MFLLLIWSNVAIQPTFCNEKCLSRGADAPAIAAISRNGFLPRVRWKGERGVLLVARAGFVGPRAKGGCQAKWVRVAVWVALVYVYLEGGKVAKTTFYLLYFILSDSPIRNLRV